MMMPGMNPTSTSERSPVCLVHLVSLVHLVYPVSLVQPNKQDKPNKPIKRDRPNRPNEQDRLADFFSILLTERETVYGA
jgi:hypothetical protein